MFTIIGPAVIGGMFTLTAVTFGWRLTHTDSARHADQQDAITLAQVAAGMSRLTDGQHDLWEVADQVRIDVAFIAGSLGVILPPRR